MIERSYRDLAPEPKIVEIILLNWDMRVWDTWFEAKHSNQNLTEQGGGIILKAGVDGILDKIDAPPEAWPWTYSYISDICNHCVSRFLGWRTPIENCNSYIPDISPFIY